MRLAEIMRSLAAGAFFLFPATLGVAQESAPTDDGSLLRRAKRLDVDALKELGAFSESLRHIDWEREYPQIRASLENIWNQNEWTDEADIFARDVAVGASEIPPWKPLQRVMYVTDKFAERYDASSGLKLRVSMALVREASGLFLRHGKTIGAYELEYDELREAGQPITAQHVARWAREGQPVLDDVHEMAERLFQEVRAQLSPAQREILERDFRSYVKRRDSVDKQMKKWSEGEWDPEDWGLESDPIVTEVERKEEAQSSPSDERSKSASSAHSMAPLTPMIVRIRCDEFAPNSWGACAAELIRRYSLDAGQRTTVDSIVAELSGRALDYYQPRAKQLEAVPVADRQTNTDFEPICRAYRELIERLEAIPTTAQRARATVSIPERSND